MNSMGKIMLAFLAGAATGAVVTYMLTTKEGDEIVDDFKGLVSKLKDNIAHQMHNLQEQRQRGSVMKEHEEVLGV